MKKVSLALLTLLFAGALAGCGQQPDVVETETVEEVVEWEDAAVVENEGNVDVSASTIKWTGTKVVGDAHWGMISLKDGNITFNDGKPETARFVIDMTSMTCDDLEGKAAERMVSHLENEDFFDVPNHPESILVAKSFVASDNGYTATADLTIKGITKEINFDVAFAEDNKSATADIVIDRTMRDITYGSSSFFDDLKDKAIDDEMTLEVSVELK